jgi:hypothetical protein
MQLYETFTDRSTHLETLFLAVDNAEPSNNMVPYKTDLEVLVLFTLLVALVLLWRAKVIDSFLFVLHLRGTLSTGLLNNL